MTPAFNRVATFHDIFGLQRQTLRLHGLFDPFNPLRGAVIVFANPHNHRDILMPQIHQIVCHLKRSAAVVEPHAGMHGLGLVGIGIDKGNVFAFRSIS